MLTSLRVRGPFTGPSGYDHHVREFVRELARRDIRIQLDNMSEWSSAQLPFDLRDPWFESLAQPVDAKTVLHFCLPVGVTRVEPLVNVNFTMFEATRIPADWREAHRRADLIVLPTQSSLRVWVDSGVPESKLRLCPLGIRADRYRPGVPPLPLGEARGRNVGSYATRFLNISELGPRKNLKGLVTAWLRATSRSDDAILIMKVGCYTPGSLALFEDELRAASRSAGKSFEDAAPIRFLSDLLADADMPRLFAAATHYVSLSFGEGWDLPMIEAAASGLRLIAPGHSAYLAYLDADIASLIPSCEVPADVGGQEWFDGLFGGANWWQPDEDAAVDLIRAAIEGRDVPRASARDRIDDELHLGKGNGPPARDPRRGRGYVEPITASRTASGE